MVALGVAIGRMRADETQVREPPVVVRVGVQPVSERFDDHDRLGMFRGEPGRCPGGSVIVGAWIIGPGQVEILGIRRHVDALSRQPFGPARGTGRFRVEQLRVETGEHFFIGRQARVVGGQGAGVEGGVGVAEQGRCVAGLAGFTGRVGETIVQRGAVEHRTVVLGVHARVQRGPARPARRDVRPVVGEAHTTGGESIERRRAYDRVTGRRETVPPPLVDGDEQHVAAPRGDLVQPGNRPGAGAKDSALDASEMANPRSPVTPTAGLVAMTGREVASSGAGTVGRNRLACPIRPPAPSGVDRHHTRQGTRQGPGRPRPTGPPPPRVSRRVSSGTFACHERPFVPVQDRAVRSR